MRYTKLVVIAIGMALLLACGKNNEVKEAGKSNEVKEVETLINNIGEVSLDSGKDIATAEEYYDLLTDKEKGEVDNYSILVNARTNYDDLIDQEEEVLSGIEYNINCALDEIEKGIEKVRSIHDENYKKYGTNARGMQYENAGITYYENAKEFMMNAYALCENYKDRKEFQNLREDILKYCDELPLAETTNDFEPAEVSLTESSLKSSYQSFKAAILRLQFGRQMK